MLLVATMVDASAQFGEDSSGNLVLDSRPGRERPLPPSVPPTDLAPHQNAPYVMGGERGAFRASASRRKGSLSELTGSPAITAPLGRGAARHGAAGPWR